MTTLTFQESGSPADPVVVFLHGGPLSSRMWRPQLARLENDFYCLAPDLPGHGGSRGLGSFGLEDAARQVAEFIQARAPGGKASLVGLSLGGAVTLTLLRLAPGVVERAMVSGTAARLGRSTGRLSLALLWMLRFMPVEKQAEATLRSLAVPADCRELVWDDFLHGATVEYNRAVLLALMAMELPERVDCPLLVAVGEQETIPARQAARKLLSLYPQAWGVVAPGLRHLWNLQDPGLFSDTVRGFVTGRPLPEKLVKIERR
jgi:pimeloyl-ACP methyl ester carboxylesterase